MKSTGLKVSTAIVRRYLQKNVIRNYGAVSKLFLSKQTHATKHQKCSQEQWDAAIVSDEFLFKFRPTSIRKTLWREDMYCYLFALCLMLVGVHL